MSAWRRLPWYCSACDTWAKHLPHRACPAEAGAGAVAIDIDEFLLTCDTCHEVWLIEDTQAICSACAHAQYITFRDMPVRLQDGDQLLVSDGTVVYVLLHSGALLITHRSCITIEG